MSEWKIGDTAWVAGVGTKQLTRPCRVCAGKRVVTLILGTGESVELPCGYCGHGCDSPTGQETFYEFCADARHDVITGINTRQTRDGTVREYVCTAGVLREDESLLMTREAAEAACAAKVAAREEEQNTRAENIKKNVSKSFAWNAGYHLREAGRCEKQAEYHRGKAVLCKARAKEAPDA